MYSICPVTYRIILRMNFNFEETAESLLKIEHLQCIYTLILESLDLLTVIVNLLYKRITIGCFSCIISVGLYICLLLLCNLYNYVHSLLFKTGTYHCIKE